ncbi:type II toxin-antitoxin system RelE/ParE family toxin [Sphingomonas bacterium]|uniref:type II toxin-antitoxin system RelE/ParE family toxin n=1 Tax=Sphingomonas bacterium TaxID=1895847 RepID=UPI001575918C|nr:type II toxin-antitoxin system RelE/ParE family toxin [Sphingomonas bacterium]
MAKVVWSEQAVVSLNLIVDYIERDHPPSAAEIASRLVDAALSLEHFSDRGRSMGGNVRELVKVRPYIIRYEVLPDVVRILRIRHAARLPLDP